MGNQVTTLGKIYPVEYYLADYCNDLTLDVNLGSTRFMKVARVKHRDAGFCVAKIYAINDPSIPLNEYKIKLEYIRDMITKSGELNSSPFSHFLINEKCIILLRQYIKYNLYDRLSTRPFLTAIEKQWIAYQLLRCVQSIHQQNIHHGDIKSENVLVTSFLWVTLADFASYKPVTLPEHNPSDFSYFFDTSRRNCCNMAPERFVEQSQTSNENDPTNDTKIKYMEETEINQLTPQMDLFSLGCVLAELFSDDTPNSSIFDLGQILSFKRNQYKPNKLIEDGISDPKVRRLILNLTDLDPNGRNSASHHLDQLVPSLFPAYFQTLYDYIAKLIPLSPDSKILVLNKDLDKLMEMIITEYDHGLLLPLIVATSTLRSLTNIDTKLVGLKLCVRLVESSPSIMSDYIIDRLLPYIMQLLAKSESRVRALCVSSLSTVLQHVTHLQPSDANVFIDYILPSLLPLAFDGSALVRISLASNISKLAETAKRFLDPEEDDAKMKLNLLQDAFGTIVSELLKDPNNNVKRALLNENVSQLCNFFGVEKTDEFILSHMITFLNDKSDFCLRVTFYDNISHISSSLGPYYAPVVKPLMQKGLADSEEIVIYRCLKAISSMTKSNLLTKDIVYELFQEAVPFLSFPNKWIRNEVINFVLVLSKADNQLIDFNRCILPALKLHLYRDIHSLHDEIVLLDSLQNPLPRVVIESILNGGDDIDDIFNTITKRKMERDKKRYRTISDTDTQDYYDLIDGHGNQTIGGVTKSEKELLTSVDRFSEDRLIDSELILRRIHKNKRTSSSKPIETNICIRRQDAIMTQNHPSSGDSNSQFNNAMGGGGGGGSTAITTAISTMASSSGTLSLTKTARPRGILLAHLHEHKNAINKLCVIPNTTHFMSCSNDATIKLWDCAGVSSKPQVLFRSKQTFISPDAGGIINMAVCSGPETVLALTENNNLHLLQSYAPSSNSRLIKSINFNRPEDESSCSSLVTDLISLSPYSYATCSTSSNIKGYDLRLTTNSEVWNLKMDGSDGLITCMDGNEFSIACGTSSSVISIFDLRFYIKATSMSYPPYQDRMRKRIRRIQLHGDKIYCSVDGNNEISTWDCESGTRTKTLWASPAPCLSSTHSSHHSVLCMIVDSSKETNSVISSGDDMKIRFWDLNNAHRSYLVSRPSMNQHHKLVQSLAVKQQQSGGGGKQMDSSSSNSSSLLPTQTYYQTKLVDGIQVIQETDKLGSPTSFSPNHPPKSATSASSPPKGQQAETMTTGSVGASATVSSTTSTCEPAMPHIGTSVTNTHSASASQQHQDSLSAHHDSISCLATVNQSNLLLSASRDGVIKIWR